MNEQESSGPDLEDAIARLRAHGGRITAPRLALLRALARAAGELTAEELAEEIHRETPTVHRATVYRNLEELERLGVLVHSHLGHGPATYQPAGSAHAHLACEHCGFAVDLPAILLDSFVAEIEEQYGFVVLPHHFALSGLCPACLAEARGTGGPEADQAFSAESAS